jgi:hypothetical protein
MGGADGGTDSSADIGPPPIGVTAASGSSPDVQAAIDAAPNGATINVPAGVWSWATPVTLPATKGITLSGSGATVTGKVVLNQNATTSSRVTGFAFVTPTTTPYVGNDLAVSGSPSSAPFRVDHNTFTSTSGGSVLVDISGNAPGLLDHNAFNAPANSEMIHQLGLGPSDSSGWMDDIVPGSASAVYLEDNTFTNNDPALLNTNPAYFYGNSAIQGYYGCRTVLRHNTFSMSQIDMHGGTLGARWWEVYANTFTTVPNGNQDRYVGMRAGSGVIFDNHKVGPMDEGGGSINLALEATDAFAYRPGRGKNLTLDPAYVWGNDAVMPVTSGSEIVLGTDFYEVARPAYAAFRYPYPLTSAGLPDPAAGR